MHNYFKEYANIKAAGVFFGVLVFITYPLLANNKCKTKFPNSLTVIADTAPHKNVDTILLRNIDTVPSTKIITDSLNPSGNVTVTENTSADSVKHIRVDTTLFSKDSLDAPITYSADDSGVLIIPTKQFILYGKANTNYQDYKLEC